MVPASPLRHRRSHPRGLALWAALPLAAALAACDVPTELPKWDTTWVVPGESTSISVSNLLPSSVTTGAGGTSFVVGLQPGSFSRTLGEMCGAVCTLVNGQTVPKPAFTAEFSSSFAFPAEVSALRPVNGQIGYQISHDLPFDPIRPSPTARGALVVQVLEGGVLIGTDSIAGEAVALAPGTTVSRTVALSRPSVSGPITLVARVRSPAGSAVRINTASRLTITPQVQVTQATVTVTNRSITGAQAELDLGDIDEAVTERTKGAALLLTLNNPFQVTGNLTLRIMAPGVNISKPLALQTGTNEARIDLNQQEIQSILGASPVTLDVVGSVSGTTTVTPSQAVAISSQLLLTIGPKEED